jgi:hypothetical protein
MSLNPKGSASHRRRMNFPISLHARVLGGVEYVCPHCFRFQKVSVVNHRRPKNRCTNRMCNRQIEFGLQFLVGTAVQDPAPWNGRFVPQRPVSRVSNAMGDHFKEVYEAIAQVVGPIEWWCPDCKARNVGKPTPGGAQVVCSACDNAFQAALILYSALPGAHTMTPVDWIPPLRPRK